MKKRALFILILVLALVLPAFTGCAEKEAGPLRICLDLASSGKGVNVKQDFYDIYATLQSAGRLEEVEVECLPAEGPERETAIDRIRTELMSGRGPDVFIVNCIRDN